MLEQLTSNWVCWIIAAVALICYHRLVLQYFYSGTAPSKENCTVSEALIAALPLLGLLGTIMGLLHCFAALANGNADGSDLSIGISNALLTTQLGLLCAIPAWLMQGFINKHTSSQQTAQGTVDACAA